MSSYCEAVLARASKLTRYVPGDSILCCVQVCKDRVLLILEFSETRLAEPLAGRLPIQFGKTA